MSAYYVFGGVDPGLDGGLAIIRTNVNNMFIEATAIPMPTKPGAKTREVNAAEVVDFFLSVTSPIAVEIVHAMKGQGVSSMFTFGKGYGKILGALEARGLPIVEVTPQRWKRDILDGLGREKDDAIRFAMNMFPKVNLKKSDRATKPNDGMAEALCLAEFARRKVFIEKFHGDG